MEENLKENLEKFKISKEKNTKKKKMMTIIAVIVVLFLGVNVFATTQGYNNIFFIIKNLVSPESADGKAEILSDRDITISYQPIKIFRDLSIQINKLIVEEDEATLYIDVTNDAPENEIDNYIVYDITDGKKELIGNHIAKNKVGGRYIEEIKLFNLSNNTQVLQLELFDKNHYKISALEINLDKKEINILTTTEEEIEKISEVELKEFLSKIVRINFFGDKNSVTKYHTVQEYKDEIKVLYALEILNKESASFEEVHKVIKEFTGETIETPLSIANVVVTKTQNEYKYTTGKDLHLVHAMCFEVSDIKYLDGVYTVNCVYGYPTESDFSNNRIEEIDKFTTTIDFVLNENYEYTKYCILHVNEFISNPYEVDNNSQDKEEDNNSQDKEEDNNSSPNTTNNNEDDSVVDNKNDSSTNTTVPVKPNNQEDDSEHTSISMPENAASTITWNEFFTPGLRGKIPAGWNIREFINGYSGPEDDGKLAKSISGTIIGIDGSTKKEVKSNVIINFYMPEFIEVLDTETYTRIVASRYNMDASWAGYTSPQGMDWKMVVKENEQREFFCHLEPLYGGTEGIGYVVEVISDNYDNEKLINVIHNMFMELRGASF